MYNVGRVRRRQPLVWNLVHDMRSRYGGPWLLKLIPVEYKAQLLQNLGVGRGPLVFWLLGVWALGPRFIRDFQHIRWIK